MASSTVREFYEGKNVFITGATGFLGKVLIERLLRVVPNIGTIYVLIRPSAKQSNVAERMNSEIVMSGVFDKLRQRDPSFSKKLRAIAGDVGNPDLGLSAVDRKELCDNVSVIIHGAATVKFHEHLQVALNINVEGVRRIIQLCRDCCRLLALVHVSTAYVSATKLGADSINEEIDGVAFDHRALQNRIGSMLADEVDVQTPKILQEHGNWPNTYTLTKKMGELVIKEEGVGLPCIVVRPTIVTCAEKDPFPGWVDTLIGPGGLVLATALGLLHVMPGNPNNTVDLIPVDYVINCIISCGWYAARHNGHRSIEAVHIGSSSKNPTKWGLLLKVMSGYFDRHPSKHQVSAIHFRWVQSQFSYQILHQLYHMLPAMAMDALSYVKGDKKKSYVSQLTRLSGIVETLLFFTTNEWKFSSANADRVMAAMHPADRQDFSFDSSEIIWDSYYEIFGHGLKRYILKEEIQYSRARL